MSAVTVVMDRAASVQYKPRILMLLGIVLSAMLVGAVVMVLVTFDGRFTSFVTVDARIGGNGNAVSKGDLVVYRDVTVGTVATSGRVLGPDDIQVQLHLIPARVPHIPSNVSATVDPVTIFGTEYVVLSSPTKPAATHLEAGDVIAETPGASGANVQGAVSSLDQILNALHPAQLDAALTAVATALQGQGKGLGKTLVSIDTYLKEMLPHLPELESDLGLLAPVANQIATSAPALVGSLSNLTTTAHTITADAGTLHQVLAGGATTANQIYGVLAPTQSAFEEILKAAGPFLRDVSQSPTELTDTLAGLNNWATSWSAAESHGPYLQFSTSVTVANATDVVLAALGAPGTSGSTGLGAQALGTGSVDPATYSSGSCTYCATASDVTIDPDLVTPAEVHATATLDAAIDHGRRPPSPSVSALFLTPILGRLAAQS